MKMSREQQNTSIMIATILIVSLITFIAIFNIIWGIVAQPINSAANSLRYFLNTQNLDYNFEVSSYQGTTVKVEPPPVVIITPVQPENSKPVVNNPIITEETPVVIEEPQAIKNNDIVVNYNFDVPLNNTNNAAINFESYPDAILADAVLAGYGNGNDTPQVNLQIIIPKIGINSPVLQGLGADDLLERGFWTYPGSNTLGEGEVVMLCHRRFFGPYDPRSCWFLDKINKGDEIIMKYTDTSLRYEVVGVNVFEGDDPLIYSISDSDDYIKIVTCAPLYSNAQRLVVLAKRTK